MKELLPVRLSHLLRHCSVGAVVRGPDALMTVMDTRHWTDRTGAAAGRPLRYVDRVRAALGIEETLREPPVAREISRHQVDGVCIPATLFPRWYCCPQCGFLHYVFSIGRMDKPLRCRNRNCPHPSPLEQVPYVLVHAKGYMDDLPWHYLAHGRAGAQNQRQCGEDRGSTYLRLEYDPDKKIPVGLACSRCGAGVKFDVFDLQAGIKFMRRQPWLKEQAALQEAPEIKKVNDIEIHLPKTETALVIPPESRIRRGTVVDRLYNSADKRNLLEKCRTGFLWESTVQRIASEFRCKTENVAQAWRQIRKGYPLFGQSFNITPGQLREEEYKALTEVIPDVGDDEDFVTRHHTDAWRRLSRALKASSPESSIVHAISRLIAVTRLKEIMIFEGFQRIDDMHPLTRPDITGENTWLPAVELFGEGIFLSLNEALLPAWEEQPALMARSEKVQKRYEAARLFFQDALPRVSPRFLLLHSFAHLLIRQLESDAGYPTASLKERIYCGAGDFSMAGILIYVAVPDVVGSLGGIVALAEPRRFLKLASAALARSTWCSQDPVCSEHEGQGLHLLNRAACHACMLIPEPSCDYRNTLLDRIVVKGDEKAGLCSFFNAAGAAGGDDRGQTQV